MLKNKVLYLFLFLNSIIYCNPIGNFFNFTHYNFLDSRAGGLGGAYTAISDTIVGSFYNPAGLIYMDAKRATESSNLFRESFLEYNADTLPDADVKLTSNAASFVGFTETFGDYKVAFSIISPKTETYDKNSNGAYEYNGVDLDLVQSIKGYNNHYLVGPSVSGLLLDNLSFGMSLFYSYEERSFIFNTFTKTSNSNQIISSMNQDTDEITQELLSIFGFQWMPMTNLSIGGSLKYPILLSSNSDNQKVTMEYTNTNGVNTSVINSSYNLHELGFQSSYTSLAFGATAFFSATTLASLDFNYMFGKDPSNETFPTTDTLNVSLGVEHYVFPFVPLRLGYYTNNSYFPEDMAGDHIDSSGYTFSVGFDNSRTSINLLLDVQSGSGHNDGSSQGDVNYSAKTILISAATNL